MPIQTFLNDLSSDFHNQSPIKIIVENEEGIFNYAPPQEFQAGFIEEDDDFITPANNPYPVNMELKEHTLFTSTEINITGVEFLQTIKEEILNKAATFVGSSFFEKIQNDRTIIPVDLISIDQVRNAIVEIAATTTEDVNIITAPGRLRGSILTNLVQRDEAVARLLTKEKFDLYHNVFIPAIRSNIVLMFNWNHSLIITQPIFSIVNNSIKVQFKIGICSVDYIIAYR